MKIKAHYNFTEGLTAKMLHKKLNLEFDSFRNITLMQIEGVGSSKIKFEKGYAIYQDKEDAFLMFRYKKHCYTTWLGNNRRPVYHPYTCETLDNFSGFVYSNRMPVDVFSKNEHKIFKNQKLKLCRICRRGMFKNLWYSNHPWYDTVLKYIEQQEKPSFKRDGYHSMWQQISEAYREKMNWKCEECSIDLSDKRDRQYLHTHHWNGNIKDNRSSNFGALCILCHSLHHKKKLNSGTGFMEVDTFIKIHGSNLMNSKIGEFNYTRADSFR